MSTTPVDLYNGQPGTVAEELYLCPAITRTFITAVTACNDTTVAKYVTIYRVPDGGTAGAANIIYNQEAIGSNESKALPNLVGHVLEPGDALWGLVEIADQITLHISGVAKT